MEEKIATDFHRHRFDEKSEQKFPPQKRRPINSVKWNCTGTRLASVSTGVNYARVWPVDHHVPSKDPTELRGHEGEVHCVAWEHTKPDQLVTGSFDKTVRIWDTRAQSSSSLKIAGEVLDVDWSHDGHLLAVSYRSGQEEYLSSWDLRKNKLVREMKFPFEVHDICWARHNSANYLYAATGAGVVLIFKNANLTQLAQIQTHVSRTYCVEIHPSNRYFATGGADAMVNVWDLEFQVSIATVPRLLHPTHTISFSHDGEFLAAGAENGVIDISHAYTGTHLKTLTVSKWASLFCVAFNPKNLVLAVSGEDVNNDGVIQIFSWPSKS